MVYLVLLNTQALVLLVGLIRRGYRCSVDLLGIFCDGVSPIPFSHIPRSHLSPSDHAPSL